MTAFAAHALLDAHELIADERIPATVNSALDFSRERLLVETGGSSYFGYYPGSNVPIHNANLLLASVFARCGAEEASRALAFSLARRRPDGLWPYGEGGRLDWVDGYHTAFILWVLGTWPTDWRTPELESASSVALDVFVDRLIDADGAARATLASRYLSTHACVGGLVPIRDPQTKRPSTGGRGASARLDPREHATSRRRLCVPAQAPLPERRPLLQVERRAHAACARGFSAGDRKLSFRA